MNLVDSSGWLEYFVGGKNVEIFSEPLSKKQELLVPSIIINEVFKVVLREKDESIALQVAATMQQGQVVDLTIDIAMKAASLSLEYKIPIADSIILATGYLNEATIWTQDIDFKNIPGVQYFPKHD